MKNLPDDELFEQLGSRLRNYQEAPDELVWKNIATATQSKTKDGVAWIDHTALGIALASLLFLVTLQPAALQSEQKAIAKDMNRITPEVNANFNKSERNNNNTESQTINSKTPSDHQRPQAIAKSNSTSASDEVRPSHANVFSDGETKENVSANENQFVVNDSRHDEPILATEAKATDSTQQISKVASDSLAKATDEPTILPKKKKRGMNFYFALSPSMNYRQVTPLQNDNVVVTQVVNEGVFSAQRFGIAFETGWQLPISSSFEIYIGLSYYHQNQTLLYRFNRADGNDIVTTDNPMAFKINVSEHGQKVNYQMNNVGLQTGFLYQLKAGPLTQKIGAGLWYQHGLHQKSQGDTYNNAQSGYLAYQILYRNEYAFSNQLKMYVQPNFTQSFYTTESLNEPFQLKPYSVGLSLGLIYTWQRK
ncbi:MAG: hypothetical protein ACOVMQ_03180 [Cyclobacteriaceae bacterium]|jgi:hypothetical protein